MRTFLAGIAGAIAMFIWASVAHMATPLGEIGVSEVPNDEPVLFALQTAIGNKDGLYMFPSYGSDTMDAESETQYEARLRTYPSGLLIYHPPGAEGLTTGRLLTEFGSDVVESLVLALILMSVATAAFLPRLAVAAGVGLCAVLATNVSYWNWYGFPLDYTLAYMATDFVGYLVAGVVILLIAGQARVGR